MRRISRPALVVALASVLAAGPARAVSPEWVEAWRADLAFAADTLPKVHANLYHTVSRERFRGALDSLSARLPELEHDAIAVELARIMALVGDGHTRLTLPFDSTAGFFMGHSPTPRPLVPELVFHHLPIRLRLFPDGLRVIRADAAHRQLLGGRVVELGRMRAADAIAAVEPVIQRDNDRQLADLVAQSLVVPEILHARGVTAERRSVRLVVETDRGRRVAMLAPVAPGATVTWLDARGENGVPRPERHPERRHWFERIEGTDAIYARLREVLDDGDRTVAAFADSLGAALAGDDAGRLILDVRGNVGGNGFLNRALTQMIAATPDLQRPGALYLLIDRGTFSAAMMLASRLEQDAPAVIVGEKTGGHPNSYGDSRRVRLPKTGLTLRVSTLYWQTTDPRDRRDGIMPLVPVELTSDAWRRGADPALDAVLAMIGPVAEPTGTWRGAVGVEYEALPLTLRFVREAGGLAVHLDMAALEARDAPLGPAAREGDTWSFTQRGQGAEWAFHARTTSNWMVGTVRYQGARLPFALRRVSP